MAALFLQARRERKHKSSL